MGPSTGSSVGVAQRIGTRRACGRPEPRPLNFRADVVLAETGVAPALQQDDVLAGHADCPFSTVIPPESGIYASFSKCFWRRTITGFDPSLKD
jgi:hypothetical protein